MLLSSAQQARFWRLWAKAEREAMPSLATKEERTELRRKTLRDACGFDSLTLVGRGEEYDKVMLAVALLANDYEEAAHFVIGSERRMAKLMVDCARQIGEIAGDPHGWEYCCGALKQARLPPRWEDVPETLLAATFSMLDTHRRRLLKREHRKSLVGTLAFVLGRRYYRDPSGVLFDSDVVLPSTRTAVA